ERTYYRRLQVPSTKGIFHSIPTCLLYSPEGPEILKTDIFYHTKRIPDVVS
ncbi:hypothetical protein STEG23_002541, partial [Scotinomys teguina]